MTIPQQQALKWLQDHNGTGVFGKHGVLIAGGEVAPFMRLTWNALRAAGVVSIEGRRITIL